MRSVSQQRFVKQIGQLSATLMDEIAKALAAVLSIG
ncbi:MAG: hypothetical protein AABP62_28500 [Planctomycetota bacterium]